MTAYFRLLPHEVIISRGVSRPVNMPVEAVQVVERTGAGTLQVETLGMELRTLELPLSALTRSEHDALLNFYRNVCMGAANDFEYEDARGDIYLVKWIGKFDISEVGFDHYAGTVNLEVVG